MQSKLSTTESLDLLKGAIKEHVSRPTAKAMRELTAVCKWIEEVQTDSDENPEQAKRNISNSVLDFQDIESQLEKALENMHNINAQMYRWLN